MLKRYTNMSILYGALIVTVVNVEAEVNEIDSENRNSSTDNISIFIRNCTMPTVALLYTPVLLSMYPYNVYCKVVEEAPVNNDDLHNLDNFIVKMREPCSKNSDIVCEIVTQCKRILKV